MSKFQIPKPIYNANFQDWFPSYVEIGGEIYYPRDKNGKILSNPLPVINDIMNKGESIFYIQIKPGLLEIVDKNTTITRVHSGNDMNGDTNYLKPVISVLGGTINNSLGKSLHSIIRISHDNVYASIINDDSEKVNEKTQNPKDVLLLEHPEKNIKLKFHKLNTEYIHNRLVNTTTSNQVSRGEVIGLVGGIPQTPLAGNTGGIHLHFAMCLNGYTGKNGVANSGFQNGTYIDSYRIDKLMFYTQSDNKFYSQGEWVDYKSNVYDSENKMDTGFAKRMINLLFQTTSNTGIMGNKIYNTKETNSNVVVEEGTDLPWKIEYRDDNSVLVAFPGLRTTKHFTKASENLSLNNLDRPLSNDFLRRINYLYYQSKYHRDKEGKLMSVSLRDIANKQGFKHLPDYKCFLDVYGIDFGIDSDGKHLENATIYCGHKGLTTEIDKMSKYKHKIIFSKKGNINEKVILIYSELLKWTNYFNFPHTFIDNLASTTMESISDYVDPETNETPREKSGGKFVLADLLSEKLGIAKPVIFSDRSGIVVSASALRSPDKIVFKADGHMGNKSGYIYAEKHYGNMFFSFENSSFLAYFTQQLNCGLIEGGLSYAKGSGGEFLVDIINSVFPPLDKGPFIPEGFKGHNYFEYWIGISDLERSGISKVLLDTLQNYLILKWEGNNNFKMHLSFIKNNIIPANLLSKIGYSFVKEYVDKFNKKQKALVKTGGIDSELLSSALKTNANTANIPEKTVDKPSPRPPPPDNPRGKILPNSNIQPISDREFKIFSVPSTDYLDMAISEFGDTDDSIMGDVLESIGEDGGDGRFACVPDLPATLQQATRELISSLGAEEFINTQRLI